MELSKKALHYRKKADIGILSALGLMTPPVIIGLLSWNKMDVFEYSVFGSPQQKIGNFTGQKKLGDFNA